MLSVLVPFVLLPLFPSSLSFLVSLALIQSDRIKFEVNFTIFSKTWFAINMWWCTFLSLLNSFWSALIGTFSIHFFFSILDVFNNLIPLFQFFTCPLPLLLSLGVFILLLLMPSFSFVHCSIFKWSKWYPGFCTLGKFSSSTFYLLIIPLKLLEGFPFNPTTSSLLFIYFFICFCCLTYIPPSN